MLRTDRHMDTHKYLDRYSSIFVTAISGNVVFLSPVRSWSLCSLLAGEKGCKLCCKKKLALHNITLHLRNVGISGLKIQPMIAQKLDQIMNHEHGNRYLTVPTYS